MYCEGFADATNVGFARAFVRGGWRGLEVRSRKEWRSLGDFE